MRKIDTGDIAEKLQVCRKHVTDRIAKRPDFPAPVINLSRKHRLWDEAEIDAWIKAASQSAR